MRPALVVILIILVLAPLAIAGWLGARVIRDERTLVEHQVRELAVGRLRALEAGLADVARHYATTVRAELESLLTVTAGLRAQAGSSPFVRQYFVLDLDGRMLHPPISTPDELSRSELDALERTRQVWESGGLLDAVARTTRPPDVVGASKRDASAEAAETGWHTWYWGNGLQLMVWLREGNRIRVAEIMRMRLLADLVGSLPNTDPSDPDLREGRIRLTDSTGRAVYQWGAFEIPAGAEPVATLPVGDPLRGWHLEYHAAGTLLGTAVAGSYLVNLGAALLVATAVLIGLAYYFYREQSREIREAAQRVSFVNQVSHELKTPLTNIRLYAEMLEDDLSEPQPAARQHLSVIVAESQRLSRLIGNILTFGRKQRRALRLHRTTGIVDDVLGAVLDHFRPALETKGIRVNFEQGAPACVSFDRDAVEQIVGNLVSNVEKYAAAGGRLDVASAQDEGTLQVTVADGGPGVSAREREKIFEPFYRVDGRLTDGVSGTGIGLAIARDLARLHGGELELVASDHGACFRLTLDCPLAAPGEVER